VIYVTDTHPLVFWSSNRKRRLGRRARRILQETEQGKHSINRADRRSRGNQPAGRKEACEPGSAVSSLGRRARTFSELSSPGLYVGGLLESVSLGAIRDPADRAIVATARHLRCPLITADGIIQDGDWVDTVWE